MRSAPRPQAPGVDESRAIPLDGRTGREGGVPAPGVDLPDLKDRAFRVVPRTPGATGVEVAATSGAARSAATPSGRATASGTTSLPPSAMVGAILARARSMPRNGSIELRFALEPNDLGLVRVRIETSGKTMRVQIAAASGGAVDALQSGVSRLTGQLQQAGFQDPDVQLSLDDAANGSAGHASERGVKWPHPRARWTRLPSRSGT